VTHPAISVVVPVFNSAQTLPELTERIRIALKDHRWEAVLVNDGSRDSSWAEIERLHEADSCIRGVDLRRNYGQHNALLAGLRAARGDIVVTIDDDLQHPPEEIPRLLGVLEEGHDVVYGTAQTTRQPLARRFATHVTKYALKGAMGSDAAQRVSPFRALRRDLVATFDDFAGPYVSIDALLSWTTSRFAWVTVRNDPRSVGSSSYTLRQLASYTLTMLTGFSIRPLRLASLLGLANTGLGAVLLIFVLVRYAISGVVVPGFVFLASMVAIFSGAQLLTLGVIGEYLARVHVRLLSQPSYAIKKMLD
jgi:undecaprenyl-phosphate 4-deoxy-4-formamido-L-arabinose transferase